MSLFSPFSGYENQLLHCCYFESGSNVLEELQEIKDELKPNSDQVRKTTTHRGPLAHALHCLVDGICSETVECHLQRYYHLPLVSNAQHSHTTHNTRTQTRLRKVDLKERRHENEARDPTWKAKGLWRRKNGRAHESQEYEVSHTRKRILWKFLGNRINQDIANVAKLSDIYHSRGTPTTDSTRLKISFSNEAKCLHNWCIKLTADTCQSN